MTFLKNLRRLHKIFDHFNIFLVISTHSKLGFRQPGVVVVAGKYHSDYDVIEILIFQKKNSKKYSLNNFFQSVLNRLSNIVQIGQEIP